MRCPHDDATPRWPWLPQCHDASSRHGNRPTLIKDQSIILRTSFGTESLPVLHIHLFDMEIVGSIRKRRSIYLDLPTNPRPSVEHQPPSHAPANGNNDQKKRNCTIATPHPKPLPRDSNHNAFEVSFTAALANPKPTCDGAHDEYDDCTPLLNSCYSADSAQETHTPQDSPPIKPPSKSKPSLGICNWHGICRNSQYTRPVADILREVLGDGDLKVRREERRYEQLPERDVATAPSEGHRGGRKRGWWGSLRTKCRR